MIVVRNFFIHREQLANFICWPFFFSGGKIFGSFILWCGFLTSWWTFGLHNILEHILGPSLKKWEFSNGLLIHTTFTERRYMNMFAILKECMATHHNLFLNNDYNLKTLLALNFLGFLRSQSLVIGCVDLFNVHFLRSVLLIHSLIHIISSINSLILQCLRLFNFDFFFCFSFANVCH